MQYPHRRYLPLEELHVLLQDLCELVLVESRRQRCRGAKLYEVLHQALHVATQQSVHLQFGELQDVVHLHSPSGELRELRHPHYGELKDGVHLRWLLDELPHEVFHQLQHVGMN